MTETLMDVSPPSKETAPQPFAEELEAARELVRQARPLSHVKRSGNVA